jgi:hypothetical protein
MSCLHRFLNYHREDLFPSWKIKYLFIGTFNPSWNKPGNNADYFYGRSNYMWQLLPRFFGEQSLIHSSTEDKILFCKKHEIGFTDLVLKVNNVDYDNALHKKKILSFKDKDLLFFRQNLSFNTNNILNYIDNQLKLNRIYFTLLGQNVESISLAIKTIENHCLKKNNPIPTHRLHTHSGQGLGKGIPRENALTHRWYNQGMCFLNSKFNPQEFPFHT